MRDQTMIGLIVVIGQAFAFVLFLLFLYPYRRQNAQDWDRNDDFIKQASE